MRYLKIISIAFVFIVFLGYWGATFLFSFPESSIVIAENYRGYKKFQTAFYQKWSFFAPPPTYNMRLHYIFRSNNRLYDIEIFENLNNKVKEKYLFNDTYANASWLLFANVDNIVQSMGKIHNSFRDIGISSNKGVSETDSAALANEYNDIRMTLQNIGSMRILLHHAGTVAREMKLPEDYDVQIIISGIDIVKYGDRYKADIQGKENIMFASSFYSNKDKKWIELND
ncbi:MAG: hypothetical protein BGO09_11025 [Bacteroidetes bacterium 47-18]|nr:MAG: hypothetical protein BGO09_11025 [Bacteroidetes bacterium 47-18]